MRVGSCLRLPVVHRAVRQSGDRQVGAIAGKVHPTCEQATHQVRDGDLVLLPYGYHPVSAPPGCTLCYLWAIAAPRARYRYTRIRITAGYTRSSCDWRPTIRGTNKSEPSVLLDREL